MQRVHGFADERREGVAVADVHVLDVELNAVEMVVAAERRETADGVRPRGGNVQHAVDRRLVEARIHHERHEPDAVRPRRRDDACIDRAPDVAHAVEDEHLRRDDRNAAGIGDEALHALVAVARVPERLERRMLRGARGHANRDHRSKRGGSSPTEPSPSADARRLRAVDPRTRPISHLDDEIADEVRDLRVVRVVDELRFVAHAGGSRRAGR